MLERYSYQDEQISNGVQVSYAHNIQYLSRNGWYRKKEVKFGMIAVAVRVENNTTETIKLDPESFRVYGPNGESIRLYTALEYGQKVKQRTGRHLLHALYGPWLTIERSSNGLVETDVIYLPVGAIIGIANAARASKANRINIQNMHVNAIWNKTIDPGEILYGTILISGVHGDNLTFEYNP